MPYLVDGNNLMHALGEGGSRETVRRLTLGLAHRERLSVTVVFDGPPPAGVPETEHLGRVRIVYSGRASADDVIVRHLSRTRQPRDWTVVTDDAGLTRRARAAGARTRRLGRWREKVSAAGAAPSGKDRELSPEEIAEWEAFFKARDGNGSGPGTE